MANDVSDWLREIGLPDYADAFQDNDIDLDLLGELSDSDLKEIGVQSLGHRRRILKAIRQAEAPQAEAAAPAGAQASDPASNLSDGRARPAPAPRHLLERILSNRQALEGERKQVTVMFADIKSSTEIVSALDPERAQRLLDSAIQTMSDAVHRYEGVVNKALGDGVMALFGAPVAHEDHAVRAGYAALAVQEGMRRLAQTTLRDLGVEVQARVGLHSGEVVVRAIGNDLSMDYDAIGPTTHLAARMEELAPPGGVRATAATWKLASGFLMGQSLGEIPVRGAPEPIEIFDISGVNEGRTRLQALSRGTFSLFVGRDREIEAIERSLDQARQGQGRVMSVVGEAGVGKSRLYHEFLKNADLTDFLVLESGSVSHGKATPFLPITWMMRSYFGVSAKDSARAVREKVVGKLLTMDDSLRRLETPLLSLFDIEIFDETWLAMEPGRRRNEILEAARIICLREAQEQPLVLVFEDLHWADSESLEFLNRLVNSIAASPVLLLFNYRPEFEDPWTGRPYVTRLRIAPLGRDAAETMLDDLIGDDASLAELRSALVTRTQGNPFFLEESVRALVEDGVLIGQRGARRLAVPFDRIATPVSVQSVIAARIDRLNPNTKQLLQAASTIGKDFTLTLLAAASGMQTDEIEDALLQLQTAEFVYETTLFPEREFTFAHALSHEVAYSELLIDRRRELHGRIFDQLAGDAETPQGEKLDRLAWHAFQAERWSEAHTYCKLAGERSFERSANTAALEAFERALDALGRTADSPEKLNQSIDLRFLMRDALFVLGEPERVAEHITAARVLIEQVTDPDQRAWGALLLAGFHWQSGQSEKGVEQAQAALAIWREIDVPERAALAHYRLAQTYIEVGDYEAAAAHAEDAHKTLDTPAGRSLVQFGGHPFLFVSTFASWAHGELGNFGRGGEIGQAAFVAAIELEHAYDISAVSFGVGHVYLLAGQYQDAIRVLRQGAEQIETHGIAPPASWILSQLTDALAAVGDRSAFEVMEEALTWDQEGVSMRNAFSLGRIGRAMLRFDECERAVELAARSLDRAEAQSEAGNAAWARFVLSAANARMGVAGSIEQLEDAYAEAEKRNMKPLMAEIGEAIS